MIVCDESKTANNKICHTWILHRYRRIDRIDLIIHTLKVNNTPSTPTTEAATTTRSHPESGTVSDRKADSSFQTAWLQGDVSQSLIFLRRKLAILLNYNKIIKRAADWNQFIHCQNINTTLGHISCCFLSQYYTRTLTTIALSTRSTLVWYVWHRCSTGLYYTPYRHHFTSSCQLIRTLL